MTETWAGLVKQAADDIASEWGMPDDPSVLKLRRLASLLEQITPEDVEFLRNIALDLNAIQAESLADRLSALSTAPTEETEDR